MMWGKIGLWAGLVLLAGMVAGAEPVKPVTYKLEQNISYYPEKTEGYQGERCKLDLYYPEKQPGFATVIWFHGGGLTNGNRSLMAELKEQKIAVVPVNYRLLHKQGTKINDCLADAAAAVAWVFRNIEKYGGDPAKIFVAGHSAGGYLAMMIGMDPKWLAAHQLKHSQIAGLIPLSGQTITHFAVRNNQGISPKKPTLDEYAPLSFVTSEKISPMLLVTGDREKEMLGRYEENAYLMRMLKLNGHQVTLYELQGFGHGMARPAMPLMLDFIRQQTAAKSNVVKQ